MAQQKTITRIESNRDLRRLPTGDDQYISVIVTESFGDIPQLKRVSRKSYRAMRDKEAMGEIYQLAVAQ